MAWFMFGLGLIVWFTGLGLIHYKLLPKLQELNERRFNLEYRPLYLYLKYSAWITQAYFITRVIYVISVILAILFIARIQ